MVVRYSTCGAPDSFKVLKVIFRLVRLPQWHSALTIQRTTLSMYIGDFKTRLLGTARSLERSLPQLKARLLNSL